MKVLQGFETTLNKEWGACCQSMEQNLTRGDSLGLAKDTLTLVPNWFLKGVVYTTQGICEPNPIKLVGGPVLSFITFAGAIPAPFMAAAYPLIFLRRH